MLKVARQHLTEETPVTRESPPLESPRAQALDHIRTGLFEHIKHVYKTLDEELVWVDSSNNTLRVDYDRVQTIQEPWEALHDYVEDRDSGEMKLDSTVYSCIVHYDGFQFTVAFNAGTDSFSVS